MPRSTGQFAEDAIDLANIMPARLQFLLELLHLTIRQGRVGFADREHGRPRQSRGEIGRGRHVDEALVPLEIDFVVRVSEESRAFATLWQQK